MNLLLYAIHQVHLSCYTSDIKIYAQDNDHQQNKNINDKQLKCFSILVKNKVIFKLLKIMRQVHG